jgi:hypothetical protein
MNEQQRTFVEAVFAMCLDNYDAGGDVITETYSGWAILGQFKTLEDVKEYCGRRIEEALNCRMGEDSDPELGVYERFQSWKMPVKPLPRRSDAEVAVVKARAAAGDVEKLVSFLNDHIPIDHYYDFKEAVKAHSDAHSDDISTALYEFLYRLESYVMTDRLSETREDRWATITSLASKLTAMDLHLINLHFLVLKDD